MATGTITNIQPDRGFGFICPDDGGINIFFHIRDSKIANSDFGPQLLRMAVEYDPTRDDRTGKLAAVNVRPSR